MKKSLIKLLSVSLAMTLLLTSSFPVFAQANQTEEMRQEFANASADEFDDLVLDYLHQNEEEKTFEQIQAELSAAGVTLTKGTGIEPNGLPPRDIEIVTYTMKRTGDVRVWLTGEVEFKNSEPSPGGLDALGISWEASKASYDSYSVSDSDVLSAGDVSQRLNGMFLFNLDDYYVQPNRGYSVTVVVRAKSSASGQRLDYATTLLHTYGSNTYNWSFGSALTLVPVGGAFTFTVNSNYVKETYTESDTGYIIL